MSSALSALRAAIGRNDTITVDADAIILGDGTRLARKKPTNFKSMRGRGAAYLLETVYFQFKHNLLPYNDYVKECNHEKVSHVTPVDKKDLIAYLKGELNDCAGLVAPEPEDPGEGASAGGAGARAGEPPAALPAAGRKRSFAEAGDADDARAAAAGVAPGEGGEGERGGEEHSRAARARNQRSLDAAMCVGNWDFTPLREKLTAAVAKLRAGNSREKRSSSSTQQHEQQKNQQRDAKAYDPRGDRYTASDDRFYRENMGSDFYEMGIDPSASFKSGAKAARANGSRGTADAAPNADKTSARSTPQKKPEPSTRENPSRFSSAASSQRPSQRSSSSGPPAKRSRFGEHAFLKPIIIVPANTSPSMLTMGNMPRFLESGEYMTVKELRSRGEGPSGVVSRLTVRRKPGGSVAYADYELVSNPSKLMPSEWDRVVAVVCTGQLWQFKKWPGWKQGEADNGISEIFRSMCGVVFHLDDTDPPAVTKNWAVTFLPLERHRRHNDIKIWKPQMRKVLTKS